jgi:hypothetical protein
VVLDSGSILIFSVFIYKENIMDKVRKIIRTTLREFLNEQYNEEDKTIDNYLHQVEYGDYEELTND